MDISGVDVDCLSDEEISVLNGIDVNNLSDDKIQDVYDNLIYGNQNSGAVKKVIPLTDQQVLDLNYDIVDMDENEISLLNGQNIDVNNLSDDEIIALYSDLIDTNNNILLAGTGGETSDYGCYIATTYVAPKCLDETAEEWVYNLNYCAYQAYRNSIYNSGYTFVDGYFKEYVHCPGIDGLYYDFTYPLYSVNGLYSYETTQIKAHLQYCRIVMAYYSGTLTYNPKCSLVCYNPGTIDSNFGSGTWACSKGSAK